MTEPGAGSVPTTPLLRYFRETLCTSPRGRDWGLRRIAEAEAQLADPGRSREISTRASRSLSASIGTISRSIPRSYVRRSRNLRDSARRRPGSNGRRRRSTREARRLARGRKLQLDFRYIDREVPLARAKPKPKQDPGALLEVDLFLANDHDRTPILAEVKIDADECPFYALMQLLAQAAFESLPQRERLVLFGPRPRVRAEGGRRRAAGQDGSRCPARRILHRGRPTASSVNAPLRSARN